MYMCSIDVYVAYMYMCGTCVHVWHMCTCVAYMYMCCQQLYVQETCVMYIVGLCPYIQDACNLLAVQNSEMLKRLAIVVTFAPETEQGKESVLTAVVDYINTPYLFVHEACNGLRWSIDFHKNYLFGTPPQNTCPSATCYMLHVTCCVYTCTCTCT